MNTIQKKDSLISPAAKRCLAMLLTAELDGHPVEFHTWRAHNAKRIPLLDELKRHRAVEGDTHCAVTFWGLMNTPGKQADLALTNCERVFKALRKHYPRHPKDALKLSALARRTKLSRDDALQAAGFLSRSPAYLSISTHEGDPNILPNEHYVTFRGFEEVKERALDENRRARTSVLLALLLEQGPETKLTWNLGVSESKEVRECWHKALDRIYRDPEGAITAAKSLLEAACKHVIEESGESSDKHLDLPALPNFPGFCQGRGMKVPVSCQPVIGLWNPAEPRQLPVIPVGAYPNAGERSRSSFVSVFLPSCVRQRLASRRFAHRNESRCIALEPGFAATAEIKTDQRRIIEFSLSALSRRVREAGRER